MKISIFDLGQNNRNESLAQEIKNYYLETKKGNRGSHLSFYGYRNEGLYRLLELLVEDPWKMCVER